MPKAGQRLWPEEIVCRFKAGTFERVKRVLEFGEPISAFVRVAVDREIARRERAKAKGEGK